MTFGDGYDVPPCHSCTRPELPPIYVSEQKRLDSFFDEGFKWPSDTSSTPRQLAKAGFVCLRRGTRVKCFYCQLPLIDFSPENDETITEMHKRHNPGCPFVKECPNINIPIESEVKNEIIIDKLEEFMRFVRKDNLEFLCYCHLVIREIEEMLKKPPKI